MLLYGKLLGLSDEVLNHLMIWPPSPVWKPQLDFIAGYVLRSHLPVIVRSIGTD